MLAGACVSPGLANTKLRMQWFVRSPLSFRKSSSMESRASISINSMKHRWIFFDGRPLGITRFVPGSRVHLTRLAGGAPAGGAAGAGRFMAAMVMGSVEVGR